MKSRGATELGLKVKEAYRNGYDDYHMIPLALKKHKDIKSGDSVVFCCRRGEREVELTRMFTDKDFHEVPRHYISDLDFVILTQYHESFSNLPIAFAPKQVEMPLAEVLSNNNKTQFHLAESEKFAHVTFFFNGGNNTPFKGETDCSVPSPKGVAFETVPELSIDKLSEKLCENLGKFDFIVTNFANGDVIGHTADKEAKLKAVEAVSKNLGKVVKKATEKDYVVIVTADHGNIETLFQKNGKPHVAHTTNKVAFAIKDPRGGSITLEDGSLGDVAPSILDIMGLAKPDCMTGHSLVSNHNFGSERKVLLLILDGWGFGSRDDNDAIYISNTPEWDEVLKTFDYSKLDASGRFVGLGEGKPGNSEAGHMNLGAGRCVAQDDIRLDMAISDGSYLENEVFQEAIDKVKANKGTLHLLTYLTYKSSHGSMDYALGICQMAKKSSLNDVALHIIFDGRSTEPGSAPELLMELESKLNEIGVGEIVDGVGRGIALDRDLNYSLVKQAYDLFTEGVETSILGDTSVNG